ncbi:MAG: zinc-binding dehydrogenase, partial [Deltaproteobacteria bacterium]|nr:zinc-binding dehydrogenase [Deltaproteobacteria bacterium]
VGAMVEPTAVAVHANKRAGLRKGMKAVVIGGGTIGLLTAQVARAYGASPVILSELIDARRAIAKTLGFRFLCNPSEEELPSFVQKSMGFADVVFDVVATAKSLDDSLAMLRRAAGDWGPNLFSARLSRSHSAAPLGESEGEAPDQSKPALGTIYGRAGKSGERTREVCKDSHPTHFPAGMKEPLPMEKYDRIFSFLWITLGVLQCVASTSLGLGNVMEPGTGFMPFAKETRFL